MQEFVDYSRELEEVTKIEIQRTNNPDRKPFWKPVEGTHRVHFLDEMTETQVTFKNETKPRIFVDIQTQDGKFVWSMSKGVSGLSTFVKILKYAKDNGNKLKGQACLVNVTKSKNGRGEVVNNYAIIDPRKLDDMNSFV